MNIIKHKQARFYINKKTTVVIYYSYLNKIMRYPTGVKVNFKDSDGLIIPWDKKKNRIDLTTLKYNQQKKDYWQSQQDIIDALLAKANSIINDYYKKDIIITVPELESLLSSQEEQKITKANATLEDHFQTFLERKRRLFESRGKIISLKDYTSTKLLLSDYKVFLKREIRIVDINSHWLEDFTIYMRSKHPDNYGEHKVSSKGQMKNSTIKKRLDILNEFFNYLKEIEIVNQSQVDTITRYKKTIKKVTTHKETLDIIEIKKLYNFKFTEKHDEQIRDIFVFLCLTGIRFQDLKDFDKRFIQKSKKGEGFIYKKSASKTGINYQIPLSKIVIEILEKYKYELPKITDQYGNRAIKDALQKTKMFDDYTQILDENGEYKKRFQAITLHKGRNSFISNLVDTVPLNELMKYSGHKKLSTLQTYIDINRPINMNYIKIFD